MARKSFRPAILQYFEQNASRHVYLKELATAIDATEDQAQGAIVNLKLAMPDYPLHTVVRGNVWTYDPTKKPVRETRTGPRMFEELATTKDGSLLIQDQDGVIYRAVEM